MIKIIMNDGAAFIGSIEKETEKEIWLDEDAAFGDIIVINKVDIRELLKI